MSRDLGLTRSEISTVYSLGTLAAALFLPRVGGLIDVHGVRRVTLLVAWAFGLTAIALAFAQGLVWLAVGFFGIRLLGQGALSLAARTIVVFRFRARLGSAIGLSGALAAIPMSLMPVLLASLIVDVGWRVTWVVGGLSVWLVVVPMAIWFLKPGHDRPLSTKNDHEQDLLTSWTRAQAVRTPMFWVVTLVTASVAMITRDLPSTRSRFSGKPDCRRRLPPPTSSPRR